LVQIGDNEPIVPEGYHQPRDLIANMSLGNFTGTPAADQTAELVLSNLRVSSMKRTPANVTGAIQSAADAHCTNLYAALSARGANPDTTDRNIINNFVAKAMAMVRRYDREMSGGDMSWDRINARSIWDGIAQIGLAIGPYDGLVDWKDPTNTFTLNGAPSRTSDKGFIFTGVAGQYLDAKKSLSGDSTVFNLFRNEDQGFSLLLTGDNTQASDPFRPICGAGPTLRLDLAGSASTRSVTYPDVSGNVTVAYPDRFQIRHGFAFGPVDDLARMAMTPGFYSTARHEARLNIWRSGDRTCPHYSSYFASRNQAIQHAGGITPSDSFKVGSYQASVQGAAASVGGFLVHRWWNDDEHAELYNLLKPLFLRYNVPGHA
jgi:hypothetical protein